MSGFEIAGVILGAFPLVIEALEKYREVAKLWGFWWEIRAEYQKCSNEIKFHRLSFKRNLKQLLLPMVVDGAQIQRLVSDPESDEWREPNVARELEDRLLDSYDLYFDIIQQLKRAMDDLNEALAVDKVEFQKKVSNVKDKAKTTQDKASVPIRTNPFSKSRREYELYRIKFTLGEAKRKALFAELKDCNERLEKLLSTSDKISELETKHNRSSRSAKFTMESAVGHLWRHADRLYKAIYRAWGCACMDQHRANIILEHKSTPDMEYLLLFLCSAKGSGQTSNSWQLRETKIKLLDIPPTDELYKTITISSSQPKHQCTDRRKPALAKPGILRKSLSTKTANTTMSSLTLNDVAASSSTGIIEDKILDLCSAFETPPPPKDPYGFLEDDHKRYYIYPTNIIPQFTEEPSVTLDDLLRRKHHLPLSRRQRYTLALTVSSSFLQLRHSAWLKSASWKKTDISFLRDADNQNTLLLDKPYVTREFSSKSGVEFTPPDGISGISLLGVLLLELCFGTLIEDHPSRQRCPAGDEKSAQFFDLIAAVEWLKDVGDEAGPDYACATEWCLLGSRSVPDGDAWRLLLFQNVVQPLERCYQYLIPITSKASGPRVLD